MKAYLIVNKSDPLAPFADQHKVFLDRKRAFRELLDAGWELNFFGLSDQIGIASIYRCGDKDLLWMPIEISEEQL